MVSVNQQLLLASLINLVLGKGSESMGGYSDNVDILKRAKPPETPAALAAEEVDNHRFGGYIITILGAIVFALGIYRVVIYSVRYVRTLTCLNNDTQRYFKMPSLAFSSIKQHLLYAPLFRRRHRQPVSIASVNVGILPSRFQTLFLTAVIAMNVVLCVHGIEWHGPKLQKLHHFRNRTGTLAIVNMLPLVVLAGRNNPFLCLLDISYDTFNLCHRWFGRIVVAEIVAHSVTQIYSVTYKSGLKGFQMGLEGSVILTGVIGTVAMLAIILQSISALRHAFYETFLHVHRALVIVIMVVTWMHLDGLPQRRWLAASITAWAIERFIRMVILVYRNFGNGNGSTKAELEALPGDAVRVTMRMSRPWTFVPGQHVFITIPSVGLWTSHPFSVAWSDSEEHLDSEKGIAMNRQDIFANHRTTMSLIVRRRTGFTNKLFQKAEQNPGGTVTVNAMVEGPYGGSQVLHSYGTVMMFAGGVGITHQVPFVRDLITGFTNGTVAARRVILIWVIQSPEHLEWIRPWMTAILGMDRRREILRIQLFVTRPRSTKEIHSPSATVQMFPGKPNVDTLIEMESENQIGCMGVSVCGPGGLGDDVREAVRKRQGVRNIDFLEESFSW